MIYNLLIERHDSININTCNGTEDKDIGISEQTHLQKQWIHYGKQTILETP